MMGCGSVSSLLLDPKPPPPPLLHHQQQENGKGARPPPAPTYQSKFVDGTVYSPFLSTLPPLPPISLWSLLHQVTENVVQVRGTHFEWLVSGFQGWSWTVGFWDGLYYGFLTILKFGEPKIGFLTDFWNFLDFFRPFDLLDLFRPFEFLDLLNFWPF
jgi:hypothetical protein